MATPEIPCYEVSVLLNSCFCKTANAKLPHGEVPVLLNFSVFLESANPEMPCGEVPVLIIYSFVEW